MDLTLAIVGVAAVATLVGATIQGSIGFGMNLVTVPVIALVAPDALPATVILIGLPLATSMMRAERHHIEWGALVWVLAGRVPGTLLGTWVVATVNDDTLAILIGAFVLLAVALSLAAPPIPVTPPTLVSAGVVSGTTGTAAGIGGPPLALLFQHHPGPTMRSTLAASFFFGTLLSMTTLAIAGEVHAYDLGFALILAPLTLVGSYLGLRVGQFLDRAWLRPAVLVFATISGIVVIVNAL